MKIRKQDLQKKTNENNFCYLQNNTPFCKIKTFEAENSASTLDKIKIAVRLCKLFALNNTKNNMIFTNSTVPLIW